MRVATRLLAAFGLHVAILIGLLVFHVGTIRETVRTGQALVETSSRLYVSSIEQLSRITQLEENVGKYAVTRDDGYLQKFEQISNDFSAAIARLEQLPLNARERAELARVRTAWQEFRARSEVLLDGQVQTGGIAVEAAALSAPLAALRERAHSLGEASQAAMAQRLATSAAAAAQAERISWAAAAVALLLSILVPGLIVRSISRELRSLQAGTRAVTRGDFEYRLRPGSSEEFAAVAQDFNTMTRRLGELDSMQRDFVSKVSHDLKTPLASMRETVNILLDEVPAPLTPQQRTLLQLNRDSCDRLTGMIAKLLNLSSLEAGTPVALVCDDLVPVARAAARTASVANRERGVGVVVEASGPVLAMCDMDSMRQLLDNLLENACKFSPQGARVELELRQVERDSASIAPARWTALRRLGEKESAALLRVRDFGPGVPEEARERIFERFYQTAAGRSRQGKGVGLGLTICREIVQLHGGAIWVDSPPGGGSTFCVLLPGGVPARALAPEPPAEALV